MSAGERIMARIFASIKRGTLIAPVRDMIRACDGEISCLVGKSGRTEIHVADAIRGVAAIRARNTVLDGPIVAIGLTPNL